MKRAFTMVAIFAILALPIVFVYAEPLVPCDGVDCQSCDFVELINRIVRWFIEIMPILCGLVVVYAGVQMVTSGGNESARSHAKSMLTNVLIGFVLLLTAWLIVDTIMKTFVDNSKVGPWNQIQCVEQPKFRELADNEGRPVVGGGADSALTDAQINARISATNQYLSTLCAGATPEKCASYQAVMAIESNGNPNAISPVGAAGLMQLMPATARTLDPSLSGMTDDQIREKLKDPTYNMQLGTKYIDKLSTNYGGNLSKTYAAYNGGPNANLASANCPGMLRWQCEWDDNAHTIPNVGYKETRNYVANVKAVQCKIKPMPGC